MHMGFVPDALVTVLRRAPAGDPTVYGIDGMEIALRRETAQAIRMRSADLPKSESSSLPDTAVLAEAAR
jgi:Fe2+ transport system protein FeoA